MKIVLSTDHAGVVLLKQLEALLIQQGHICVNVGPSVVDPTDDYPDFIFPAAQAVGRGEYEKGIIMGGSGQGEAMAANRIKGVRCAVYYGPAKAASAVDAEGTTATDEYEILRLTRRHNDANMLSLAARFLTWQDIEMAVALWLETPFSNIERHAERIAKLDQ